MFFALSKIVWALVSPLNFLLLLLAAGLLFFCIWRRAGVFLLCAGAALFVIAGFFPLGQNLLAGLENRYERPAMPPRVDGIVVLGGAFETALSAARGEPAVNDGAERIIEGLRLARLHPNALLVFSGGEGRLRPAGRSEAEDAKSFLRAAGFDPDNAVYEDESRNTWENAVFTKDMVMPLRGETWILVTSAYHMPRAMAVFASAGWTVVPWPVDYRTDGRKRFLPERLDADGNFYETDVALHEYAGLLAYRLTGKIASR